MSEGGRREGERGSSSNSLNANNTMNLPRHSRCLTFPISVSVAPVSWTFCGTACFRWKKPCVSCLSTPNHSNARVSVSRSCRFGVDCMSSIALRVGVAFHGEAKLQHCRWEPEECPCCEAPSFQGRTPCQGRVLSTEAVPSAEVRAFDACHDMSRPGLGRVRVRGGIPKVVLSAGAATELILSCRILDRNWALRAFEY